MLAKGVCEVGYATQDLTTPLFTTLRERALQLQTVVLPPLSQTVNGQFLHATHVFEEHQQPPEFDEQNCQDIHLFGRDHGN
jgi:hypothetical protein